MQQGEGKERGRGEEREEARRKEEKQTSRGIKRLQPFFCYLRECRESNQWTCEIVQTYTRAVHFPWRRYGNGGEEKERRGEERRARGNVGRKICGRSAGGKMENKIRDQSNAGVESMRWRRRRGGRREGWEDIMLQVDEQGEERRKCRRGEGGGGSLKSSNDLLIDEGPKL